MNERIQALMEQAKRPLGELRPKMANTGAKWDMVLDPEKFAELIVRECLGLLGSESAYGKSHIRQHFGVDDK